MGSPSPHLPYTSTEWSSRLRPSGIPAAFSRSPNLGTMPVEWKRPLTFPLGQSQLLEQVDVLQADDVSARSRDLADVGDAAAICADAEDGLSGMLRGVCFAGHGWSVCTWGAGWGGGVCTGRCDCGCARGFDCGCAWGLDCDCAWGLDCDCTGRCDCVCAGRCDCVCARGFDCGCAGDCD